MHLGEQCNQLTIEVIAKQLNVDVVEEGDECRCCFHQAQEFGGTFTQLGIVIRVRAHVLQVVDGKLRT